jgi:hypothetical protein
MGDLFQKESTKNTLAIDLRYFTWRKLLKTLDLKRGGKHRLTI